MRQQCYQRLIGAGTGPFGARGYAATPIDGVCSRAKVSTRHFHEQFDGRESILHAVYDAIVADTAQIVGSFLTRIDGALTQRVADSVEAAVYHLMEQPGRGRIVCIEAVGVSPVMEQKRRKATHARADVISRYANLMADNGELPKRDYRLPGIALVGMVNELIAEWLTEHTGLSAREMAREAKILYRAMIFGAQRYQPTEDEDSPMDARTPDA